MMPPGLMIAAPRSGGGKTTVTLGLIRALTRGGIKVAAAKCGPDYIDGAFHAAAGARSSVNLDSWAMPPELMASLAAGAGAGAEIMICEALMGLFDGVPAATPGRTGSSADVAAAMSWPVLLVLDASGQSQSAAAVALGCARYDPRIRVAGVLLNRIGSPRHARLAGEAIRALGIPVVGALPRSDAIVLPERHLGLVQAGETGDLDARLDRIADFLAENADIDAIRELAAAGPAHALQSGSALAPPGQRIYCRVGATVRPKSVSSRRSPTRRRTTVATSAGCRAATPSFMPVVLQRPSTSAPAFAVSPGRGRSMASAAAIWRWARR
jgi:cobyrinic acid a,c-diamide synthase